MPQSLELVIAKLMLKQTLFATDTASADTIWRQQRPEVRDAWRERAAAFINDLVELGYGIEKS